jgi:Lysylphosphatidylglycerol synthase TM region
LERPETDAPGPSIARGLPSAAIAPGVPGCRPRPRGLHRALCAAAYALAGSALVWLVSHTDLGGVRATLVALGPLAALVLVPLGLQVLLEALSWRMLLGRLGHRVGIGLAWRVNVQAEAVRLSFPGGPPVAEAMRPMLFARLRSVALADAASALVVRKLCHLSTEGVFLAMGTLLGSALFETWARSLGPAGRILPFLSGAAALGLVAAGVFIGLLLSHGSLAVRLERFLAGLTPGRLASFLETRRASFITLDSRLRTLLWRSPGTLSWNLLTGLGGWLLDAAETFLVLHLTGFPIGPGEALGVEALVAVMRSCAFAVPGGLGIQDLTYHALLQGTVSDAASMSLILLKRARDVFWVATGFGLPLLLDRLRPSDARLGASSSWRAGGSG